MHNLNQDHACLFIVYCTNLCKMYDINGKSYTIRFYLFFYLENNIVDLTSQQFYWTFFVAMLNPIFASKM